MLNKHMISRSTSTTTSTPCDTIHHTTSQRYITQQQQLQSQLHQHQQYYNPHRPVQSQQQHLFSDVNHTQQTYFAQQHSTLLNGQHHEQQQQRQQHLSPNDASSLGINLEQYISKRNERERSRVRNVNDAFDNLKNSLPSETERPTKRMSKVEILRTAISYIRNLEEVLGYKQRRATDRNDHQYQQQNQRQNQQQKQQQQRTNAINELSSLLLAATSTTPTSSSSLATSTSASSSASSPALSAGDQQVTNYYLEQQLGSPSDLMRRLHLERTSSCYTLADDQQSISSAMASPVYDLQQPQEHQILYQHYQPQHQHSQPQPRQQQLLMLQDGQYNCAAIYSDQMRNDRNNNNHRQIDQYQGF